MRTEGKVSILQRANDVFFNPAQVINRDMSLSGEQGQQRQGKRQRQGRSSAELAAAAVGQSLHEACMPTLAVQHKGWATCGR